MADRGRELFEGRVEYPLPAKPGVRDYVFHCVPSTDGYGEAAHRFLGRFYPRHVTMEAPSLEAVIDLLHADVTHHGVTQIRELVIVVHATPQGMILPVLDAASATTQREYRYTWPPSLAFLQKDFADGYLTNLRDKRTAVVARLFEDSWVTIRACRIGLSDDMMYALFSFFGGRANVYASRVYQFFGPTPLAPGMRIESTLALHQHLFRQRFLPDDEHSPERRDEIVGALADPARFSAAVDLAAMRLTGADPTEAARYEGLIDGLNARRNDPALRGAFAASGHVLSMGAKVTTRSRDAAWRIADRIEHEGEPYDVEYQVAEEIEFPESSSERWAFLRASARIVVPSSSPEIPIQLFFSGAENDEWHGKLFDAFRYAGAEPADRQKLEAIVAMLDTNIWREGEFDLAAIFFAENAITLSGAATVARASSAGSGDLVRITWLIIDGNQRYAVKLHHPVDDAGVISHVVSVYLHLEDRARLEAERTMMAHLGVAADVPGTELPAYLDRFGIDELVALIDHLRAPYRASHSYYIHHAQQAIKRKKGYFQWWQDTYQEASTAQPLADEPYVVLSLIEAEDKKAIAYDFAFNDVWREVKASFPGTIAFNTDLFSEEDLWQRLHGDDELPGRDHDAQLDTDSPFADLEQLRRLESEGLEEYFSTDKPTVDDDETPADLGCAEFAAIIARLQTLQVQGHDDAELERLLGLEVASDGKSFLDHVLWLWTLSAVPRMGLSLNNMTKVSAGLVARLIDKIPLGWLTRTAPYLAESPFLWGVQVLPTVTIPWTLWKRFLDEQSRTEQSWEDTGKIVAIRQWLRELIGLTVDGNVITEIHIDLGWPGRSDPSVPRYFSERRMENHDYTEWVYSPERLQEGFEEGVRLMEPVGPEILKQADEVMSDAVRGIQLDACQVDVLVDAGILDLNVLRNRIIREIARTLLDQVRTA